MLFKYGGLMARLTIRKLIAMESGLHIHHIQWIPIIQIQQNLFSMYFYFLHLAIQEVMSVEFLKE